MPVILDSELITEYVERHIGEFHSKRIESISNLRLSVLLKRKNPYLLKAKNMECAQDIVRSILDAHLSSQEETMFGTFLEFLAIYISTGRDDGRRGGTADVDLDFDRDGIRYLVCIKSGPNWGNRDQHAELRHSFSTARRRLGLDPSIHVMCVEGICYGRKGNEDQGAYLRKCGQSFWEFITGSPTFYQEIIVPIGHQAHERNAAFAQQYSRVVNAFTSEFLSEFCKPDMSIDWNALVAFSSSTVRPPRTRTASGRNVSTRTASTRNASRRSET